LIDYMILRGRRIYCLVYPNGKQVLLVPLEAKAKVRGKEVSLKIKDVKNPMKTIKLLAC